MPSTPSLAQRLKSDYPQFNFKQADDYLWSPTNQTVYYAYTDQDELLMHELAHGLLGHTEYHHDVELVAIERSAWDKALELAENYNVSITDGLIESTLDSYRDWLHARSTCPACSATGLQIKKQTYRCPACQHTWRVNEARVCALRRFSV